MAISPDSFHEVLFIGGELDGELRNVIGLPMVYRAAEKIYSEVRIVEYQLKAFYWGTAMIWTFVHPSLTDEDVLRLIVGKLRTKEKKNEGQI